MSRLSTKQRRARAWRREWEADAKDHHATCPDWWKPAAQYHALVPLMCDYGQSLCRAEEPLGLGLRSPLQRAAYWKRMERLRLSRGGIVDDAGILMPGPKETRR